MEEGAEERAVFQFGRVEVRALLRREQAGEGGEPEPRFATSKAPEDDPDGLPEIALAIVGASADGPVAKAAETVSIGIEPAGRAGCILRVQQAPFFDREQEDEPVDKSQELPEVTLLREIPRVQRGTKLLVRGVGKEPLPQDLERLPEAVTQLVPRPSPLLPAGFPPHLQRACLRRVVGTAETRLVGKEPQRGEVGVQVLREDPAEVGFDPRRPREARVVARDPQRKSVRRETPERRAGGVQDLLQEPEGAPSAPVVAELGQGGVQARSHRGYDDGNSVADSEEPDRIHPLADRPSAPLCITGREIECVAQKCLEEALGKRAGVTSRGATCLHFPKARLGNAPAPGDLVADMEPLWNAVVGRLLRGGLELSHLSKPLGPEKTALDRERIEGDPSLSRAASTWRHGQSSRRQEHVHADHVGTREGLDGGASGRSAGFAHAQMVVEQGARTFCRECLEIRRALLEQHEGSCDLARSHMPRGIVCGIEARAVKVLRALRSVHWFGGRPRPTPPPPRPSVSSPGAACGTRAGGAAGGARPSCGHAPPPRSSSRRARGPRGR